MGLLIHLRGDRSPSCLSQHFLRVLARLLRSQLWLGGVGECKWSRPGERD
jgi:hypothetical protein